MKNIAVVTSSRADYGLLRNLVKLIKFSKKKKLHLVVTGTHLSKKHGYTVKEIYKDKLIIQKKIFLDFKSDNAKIVTSNISKIIKNMTKFFIDRKIDLVILLGDRYEIFASAIASVISRVKIAHIHGGEITEGSMDELFRHSVTKLSNVHITATKTYKKRIVQLGENPKYIFNAGALCNDTINSIFDKNKKKNKENNILISFHSENVNEKKNKHNIKQLLSALKILKKYRLFFTSSNSDQGNVVIMKEIKKFIKKNKNSKLIYSYGHENFLKKMRDSLFVIGNSSSGIIEAPLVKVPSINIGLRQKGRVMSKSIINCECKKDSINKAILKIFSYRFKNHNNFYSEYKNKNVAKKILAFINKINIKDLENKVFFDLKI